LFAEQIALAGKSFEGDIAVAVEFVPDDVEIVGSARHRQAGAPPVLDTLVLNKAPGIEPSDLVRTAAERRLERGLVERTAGVIGAEKIGSEATNSGTSRARFGANFTTRVA